MAKKLDTTPNGVICPKCGEDKPNYDYYNPRGKATSVTRYFFINGWDDGVCWDCNGPYACLGCGVIQPASEFRVGGRYCKTCKNGGIHSVTRSIDAQKPHNSAEHPQSTENTLESGGRQ